ncbi:hypothetical protein VTO42DRAFT_2230 [Malbranchea cinnamomea]
MYRAFGITYVFILQSRYKRGRGLRDSRWSDSHLHRHTVQSSLCTESQQCNSSSLRVDANVKSPGAVWEISECY